VNRQLRICDLRVRIPASFEAAEKLFAELRCRCAKALQPGDYFTAELLMREALGNAIVHGSQSDPNNSVYCAIRMKVGRLTVSVSDDGPGFDWRGAQAHRADSCACSGRGLEIFRQYASRIRFNAKGNAITLTRNFRELGAPDVLVSREL